MVDINDFNTEKSCSYKGEKYLVRDNGAVLRKQRVGKKKRKLDEEWTFGKVNVRTGYLEIASERVHRIVAFAFLENPPTEKHIVDHIDTNRRNNRPSNLRWITRLENVVLNEITRGKIEYITGVSIFEFLKNPSEYRDMLGKNSDFSWMRNVTEKEAEACLSNLRNLARQECRTGKPNTKIGEWIFKTQTQHGTNVARKQMQNEDWREPYAQMPDAFPSLTSGAMQRWKTPTLFPCCPSEITNEPLQCYLNRLVKNEIFSSNQYGDSRILQFALVNNSKLFVVAENKSLKPFSLTMVTYEYGYYVHESKGTFFLSDAAEKYFMLAQGLEWTGGECFDDYC